MIARADNLVNENKKIDKVLFAPYVYNRLHKENLMIIRDERYKVYYYDIDIVSNKITLARYQKNIHRLKTPFLIRTNLNLRLAYKLKYHKISRFIEYLQTK